MHYERETESEKYEREAESLRERKNHVDEDLVVGAEAAVRVRRSVQAAESPSSPGARQSHRPVPAPGRVTVSLTESSCSWPEGPIVVFLELRTFGVLHLGYLLPR